MQRNKSSAPTNGWQKILFFLYPADTRSCTYTQLTTAFSTTIILMVINQAYCLRRINRDWSGELETTFEVLASQKAVFAGSLRRYLKQWRCSTTKDSQIRSCANSPGLVGSFALARVAKILPRWILPDYPLKLLQLSSVISLATHWRWCQAKDSRKGCRLLRTVSPT